MDTTKRPQNFGSPWKRPYYSICTSIYRKVPREDRINMRFKEHKEIMFTFDPAIKLNGESLQIKM